MSDRMDRLQRDVADHMDRILENFIGERRITVLVRHPTLGAEHDFMLTDDSFDEIVAMVERRRIAEESPPSEGEKA